MAASFCPKAGSCDYVLEEIDNLQAPPCSRHAEYKLNCYIGPIPLLANDSLSLNRCFHMFVYFGEIVCQELLHLLDAVGHALHAILLSFSKVMFVQRDFEKLSALSVGIVVVLAQKAPACQVLWIGPVDETCVHFLLVPC